VTVERAGECEASEGQSRAPEGEDEDACQRAAAEPRVIDRPLFCASDGRTYYNHRHYACAVQRDGDWFPYRIVRLNMPCEAADTPCERLRLVPDALRVDPVCANDGITYASPLALMCAMANNEGLKRHHRGQCLSESEEEGGHGHDHGGGGGHQGGDAGSQGDNNSNNSNNGSGGSDPGGNSNGNGGGDGGTPGDNTGAGSGGTDAGGDDYDDNQEAGGNGTNQSQNQEPQGPPGSEGAPESTESPETSGSPGSSGSPEPEGSQDPQPKPPAENPRKDDAEELDLSREPR
ncbi:Serine protease inhibitor dipetalogastin, partial [Gryllus bimaculatus]